MDVRRILPYGRRLTGTHTGRSLCYKSDPSTNFGMSVSLMTVPRRIQTSFVSLINDNMVILTGLYPTSLVERSNENIGIVTGLPPTSLIARINKNMVILTGMQHLGRVAGEGGAVWCHHQSGGRGFPHPQKHPLCLQQFLQGPVHQSSWRGRCDNCLWLPVRPLIIT